MSRLVRFLMAWILLTVSFLGTVTTFERNVKATSWDFETIDIGEGDVGEYTSLDLDAAGNPHISYIDETNHSLKYAGYSGGAWQITELDADVSNTNLGGTSIDVDTFGAIHVAYHYKDATNRHRIKYFYWDGVNWRVDTLPTGGVWGDLSIASDSSGKPGIAYLRSSFTLGYAKWDGAKWNIEIADASASTGSTPSLAFDSGDKPRISYGSYSESSLRYAVWTGTAWDRKTVDGGAVGWHSSLTLDSGQRPHISYYDYGNYDLKYAHWNGTDWEIETVDSAGLVGQRTSLALGSDDRPHISYYSKSAEEIRYAHWNGTMWTIRTVQSFENIYHWAAGYSSIGLRPSGDPCVSYYDYDELELVFAEWDGLSWDTQIVDIGEGDVGPYNSLVLDTKGRPHVSYYDEVSDAIKYAHWNGLAWDRQTVDIVGMSVDGGPRSIAVDSMDRPHIVYPDFDDKELRYAYWNGSAWSIEVIDSSDWPIGPNSLVLDSNDMPHVSYYEMVYDDLKYAHWNGSAWSVEIVDTEGWSGFQSGIALDSSNRPHISYTDYLNSELKYARRIGQNWDIIPIDSSASGPSPTDIVLDSLDRPHISYNGGLRYVTWTGTEWEFEVVDTTSFSDTHSSGSIALDSFDGPHILYSDEKYDDLRLAKRTQSGWLIEVIADYYINYVSLAIDSNDNPYISYYRDSNLIFGAGSPDPPNTPPTAYFTVSPTTGDMTTAFHVDASLSSDSEDSSADLVVRWDWENDGFWDTSWSSLKTAQHQYTSPGDYTILLEVGDTGGLTDTKTRQVQVENLPENEPPVCEIIAPTSGSVVSGVYTIRGTASDPDGTVYRVSVRIGNSLIYMATGTTTWSYLWDTEDYPNGTISISAWSNDGEKVSNIVAVTVTIDNPVSDADGSEDQQDFSGIAIAVAIGILLFIIILLFLLRRRRQGEQSLEGNGPSG